jgi:sugar phosphate isomerase/epimerase
MQPLTDLSRCAIHTITNKTWSLPQCLAAYKKAGIAGISVWRQSYVKLGATEAAKMVRDSGLKVPALVRGGFFVAPGEVERTKALDENRRVIDDARAIGAEMVVLVAGAKPGVPLEEARKQVADGIAAILPHAQGVGIKLGLEPLHPMYAAARSCINRMTEARLICQALNNPMLGIVVDAYHVWWDPELEAEIALAGQQKRIFAYHVSDWRVQTRNLITDRALMGNGCINLRRIRTSLEAAGFNGLIEVEILSDQLWAVNQNRYLALIGKAFMEHV